MLISSSTTASDNCLYQPDFSPNKKSIISGNVVYGNHKEIYQDLIVCKSISKAKFPVFLVESRVTKKNYAMKVFAHENGQPHLYFKNESRFACLQHPNVVRNLYCESQRKSKIDGIDMQISYIITEYALHGDLHNFLKIHRKKFDEKLIRTLFRQLIEGLEYLHKNGVSHMDLKLDNLLIGDDYNLKIADFDLSHFKDDAIIISNGTKFYRAPEVIQGRCNNPKIADIFSAGVVLFTLKSRGIYPQFEANSYGGVELSELLFKNKEEFWKQHCIIQKKEASFFDDDFKELFEEMTKPGIRERATIENVKASKWYNGPYYSSAELKEKMERILCDYR